MVTRALWTWPAMRFWPTLGLTMLSDTVAPAVLHLTPVGSAQVSRLTQIEVVFSEPVEAVNPILTVEDEMEDRPRRFYRLLELP